MDRASRTRVITLVVLLAISIPLVVLAAAGGGEDERPVVATLRVEPAQGAPEMLVFVKPGVNRLRTTDGRRRVTVECVDGAGEVLLSQPAPWPFTDTDNGLFDPHVHVFVEPAVMRSVARCRLAGTDPLLQGRKL